MNAIPWGTPDDRAQLVRTLATGLREWKDAGAPAEVVAEALVGAIERWATALGIRGASSEEAERP